MKLRPHNGHMGPLELTVRDKTVRVKNSKLTRTDRPPIVLHNISMGSKYILKCIFHTSDWFSPDQTGCIRGKRNRSTLGEGGKTLIANPALLHVYEAEMIKTYQCVGFS